MTVTEFGYPILISVDFYDFFSVSVFSLVLVSIEKIYQTLETVFHWLSTCKHLKFRQKYSAAHCIFNSLLGVWISRWNAVSRVWYITYKVPKMPSLVAFIFTNIFLSLLRPSTNRTLSCWQLLVISNLISLMIKGFVKHFKINIWAI